MNGPYRHDLGVTMKPVAELEPWLSNPRFNDVAAERLSYTIASHGWTNPILLDRNGRIVAGHTRFKAALKLGLTEVPTITLDVEGKEAEAIAIADNRLGEVADWDNDALGEVLRSLGDSVDMAALGFDEGEMEWIMEGGLDLDGLFDGPDFDDEGADPGEGAPETDVRVVQLAFSGEEFARYERIATGLREKEGRPMPDIVLDALEDRFACAD